MQIILASKSPRRIELLREIGLKFDTYNPDFEENTGSSPDKAPDKAPDTPDTPDKTPKQPGAADPSVTNPSAANPSAAGPSASEIALGNALGKAKEASRHFKNAIIIGVDTVGESHGHILGKPKNRKDAARLIRLISGTTHKVVSAVAVINTKSGRTLSATTETLVTMEKMDEREINAYIDSGEGDDKAAAYAIQGKGSLFIRKIEGDYFNVVGLPVYTLKKLLEKFGVKLI